MQNLRQSKTHFSVLNGEAEGQRREWGQAMVTFCAYVHVRETDGDAAGKGKKANKGPEASTVYFLPETASLKLGLL